jgi:thiol-disulfide isomerase/thioredoxin
LMLSNLTLVVPPAELKSIYNQFTASIKNSRAGKLLYDKIESLVATAIGKPLINFSQVGYDGKVVNTAELKGKVIILDFWGSWCVPCRKSHPGLKKIYEKYHAKGLEIIGIANESTLVGKTKEEQTKAWQKAINEDKLPWLQILYDDTKNDLVKMFEITGYPTKFIIDQNGKFALKVLGASENSEADLEKKIAELIK